MARAWLNEAILKVEQSERESRVARATTLLEDVLATPEMSTGSLNGMVVAATKLCSEELAALKAVSEVEMAPTLALMCNQRCRIEFWTASVRLDSNTASYDLGNHLVVAVCGMARGEDDGELQEALSRMFSEHEMDDGDEPDDPEDKEVTSYIELLLQG